MDNANKIPACELVAGCCWNCSYADECGNWNDTDPDDIPMVSVPAQKKEKEE